MRTIGPNLSLKLLQVKSQVLPKEEKDVGNTEGINTNKTQASTVNTVSLNLNQYAGYYNISLEAKPVATVAGTTEAKEPKAQCSAVYGAMTDIDSGDLIVYKENKKGKQIPILRITQTDINNGNLKKWSKNYNNEIKDLLGKLGYLE